MSDDTHMSDIWDPWSYHESTGRTVDSGAIVGYKVHATDGDIGKIDQENVEVGASRIVVDTGPWIFGRQVVLPAGTIKRIDEAEEIVYVGLTKEQIKDSPELTHDGALNDPEYWHNLSVYYGPYFP